MTDMEVEDGDRIFITSLHQPPEEIHAASTISQCLAEAFKWNQNPPAPKKVALLQWKTSLSISESSALCSPKNPLMSCQTTSPGIMP